MTFSEALTIENAETARQALMTIASQDGPVLLDLKSVDAVDFAGYQLLCSARKLASDGARDFQIVNAPPALVVMEETLGLKGYLGVALSR